MAELAPHEEKKQIKDLVDNTKLKEGQEWFVVDYKWWQLWKSYVNYDNTGSSGDADEPPPRPGLISNADLLDSAPAAGVDSSRLRPGLVEEYDYVVVPKEAWIKLEAWYAHHQALGTCASFWGSSFRTTSPCCPPGFSARTSPFTAQSLHFLNTIFCWFKRLNIFKLLPTSALAQ
jgi:hypothetical protein